MPSTAPHLGNSIASRDIASLLHPYTNLKAHESVGPMVITGGRGVTVVDDAGREYIEGVAGLWCTSLGFDEPRLVEAAVRQLRTLPFYHAFAHKSHEPGIELAEKLVALAPVPMSKAFFACSGSEANDTAVKLVWYYNNALGRPQKKKIIGRIKAYHGVTVASASLTGLPNNHRDFDLPIDRILHTDCPHWYRFHEEGEDEEAFASRLAASLEALIQREGPETVAAFIAEPVMGAGGVIVPPRTYFEKIQAVLRKHDVLLIADEVICGFGRTGAMFGSETFGLKPDIMTMAKALTSAYMPLSAVLVSEPIYRACVAESEKIGVFGHGYTYSGHPVSCAVALETLKIYEERDIVAHTRAVGARLQEGLARYRSHPLVGEVRGVGLIAGVELVADKATRQPFDPKLGVAARLAGFAQGHGAILRPIGDTLGFSPPLIITPEEVDELVARFGRALDDTTAWLEHEHRFRPA
ncbi:aspartate aminotransferase family protein [Rhodospirillum centenum]|uniref:Aminotransferase, class III n=1 Tax=Rhodospirillum centenum (strain ATCC 51521 / SW) TaxID=414684 RepID=B6ISI5_RHOCS|nr:aspartate aminotransferase family protein [Rhodospirillum centenum]ACI98421.1 aminotransferase, class III [Rhodospirillum centenum SW]